MATQTTIEIARQQLMADVYEDFEVRGELRISQKQCALIGRLRPEDMHATKLKLKDPTKDVYSSHGIDQVVDDLKAKGLQCHRFTFRVTPPATHMLSLFHAYIFFDESQKSFCIKLNMKSITSQRQVRFVSISTDSVDHKRDLFCRINKDKGESGRFEATLKDGDILQLGMEESVNRLRITIYMGEDGDGVEPYLHIREEPDARHVPMMMKLWEICEKLDSMQEAMNILSASVQDYVDPTHVADLGKDLDDEMDEVVGIDDNSHAKQDMIDKEYLDIGDEGGSKAKETTTKETPASTDEAKAEDT